MTIKEQMKKHQLPEHDVVVMVSTSHVVIMARKFDVVFCFVGGGRGKKVGRGGGFKGPLKEIAMSIEE